MTFGPLATTSVGSFPRPLWLAHTQRSAVTFNMEGATLEEALEDATLALLHEQEELGLDLLTDGELRRRNFIFHRRLDMGRNRHDQSRGEEDFRNRAAEHIVPRIIGKVRRLRPAAVEDLSFAKAHTSRPVKMQVPGPMTVIDSSANEFYADEAELAMDIAVAVNAELRDLQAAGCDLLQIDEPAMTRYHDKVRAYGAKALDRCLDGIHVPTVVHLCYGYPGGDARQYQYEYTDLLPDLMATRIGGFTVEFGRSPFDPGVLKACGDRLVLFGCVDPGDTRRPRASIRFAAASSRRSRMLPPTSCCSRPIAGSSPSAARWRIRS